MAEMIAPPTEAGCLSAAKLISDHAADRPDRADLLNVAGFLELLAPQINMLTAMLPPA